MFTIDLDGGGGTTTRESLGLGTADSPVFKNLTLAGGTITASSPATITQTWNNSGGTFVGLLVDIADTASHASSKLLCLKNSGVERVGVKKDGSTVINAPSGFSGTLLALQVNAASVLTVNQQGTTVVGRDLTAGGDAMFVSASSGRTQIYNSGVLAWSSGANASGAVDVGIARVSAGVLKISDVSSGFRDLQLRSLLCQAGGWVQLPSYTVATVPAGAGAGSEVYVTDSAGGPCMALRTAAGWVNTNTGAPLA